MGTYIYGINRTKQHKTYGTIGVLNFLYKPYWSPSPEQEKWEQRTDKRILKRWATGWRLDRVSTWSNKWGYEYSYVDVPTAWAFPRVVSVDGGKELYYYKGVEPLWNDGYESQIMPLAEYIATGGIVEVYDPTTKTLSPLPLDTALVG